MPCQENHSIAQDRLLVNIIAGGSSSGERSSLVPRPYFILKFRSRNFNIKIEPGDEARRGGAVLPIHPNKTKGIHGCWQGRGRHPPTWVYNRQPPTTSPKKPILKYPKGLYHLLHCWVANYSWKWYHVPELEPPDGTTLHDPGGRTGSFFKAHYTWVTLHDRGQNWVFI